MRKEIREQVHFIRKFGILDQVKRYNDIYYIDRVLGRLGYWKLVEPDNEFVNASILEIKASYKKVLKEL